MSRAPNSQSTVDERRAHDRRVVRRAFLASLVVHGLIFMLFRGVSAPVDPYAAVGPDMRDREDAAGSLETVQMVVREPARRSVTPDARPIPVPEIIEIPEVTLDPVSLEDGLAALVIGEIAARPGRPGGTGQGAGGAGGGGTLRTVPPSPRGMIIPPTHDALKGKKIEVWVFVNEDGRVVADSTRLVPTTGDARLDERLIREAADWRFSPGLEAGQAVAAWFPYTISM